MSNGSGSFTWQSVEEEASRQEVGYWRANEYRLVRSNGEPWLEAKRGATWSRFSPMRFYRPVGKGKKSDGPHIHLLNYLNKVRQRIARDKRDEMLRLLADRYGLLGTFYDWYSAPVLPAGKMFVAPEAVIKASGELVELDPAASGFDLLERRLRHEFGQPDFRLSPGVVAQPSEVRFFQKRERLPGWRPDPAGWEPHPEPFSWNELKEHHKGLLILDPKTSVWGSVICQREHAHRWLFEVPDLPGTRPNATASEKAAALSYLNRRLVGVSPYGVLGEDGEAERSWRVTSLVQAIHLMLYLDLTGGADVRRCALSDCGDYFRTSKNSSRKYCPDKGCGTRATSRRYDAKQRRALTPP